MPIFSYFAVVGSVLVALLFAADATLDKRGPLPFNSEFAGLPKAWHPETDRAPILAATPAPAPDMTSEAVRAAAPRADRRGAGRRGRGKGGSGCHGEARCRAEEAEARRPQAAAPG